MATINGTSGNDDHVVGGKDLIGTTGNDTIHGLFGNDYIFGNGGNLDQLFGDGGNDFMGVADGGNHLLDGGSGNDQLFGANGNDSLKGGRGNDLMQGGTGNDFYYVDSSSDGVIEFAGQGIRDTIASSISFTLPDNVENLTLAEVGNINGSGNSLDNYISGNFSDNILKGGGGNDSLDGLLGNDTLDGGAGNDQLAGDGDGDTNLPGGKDTLIGGRGDDQLFGMDDNDILFGASSASESVGTIDTLTGGAGGDVFVLGNASSVFYNDNLSDASQPPDIDDYALIKDFNTEDTIQLHIGVQYILGSSPIAGVSGTSISQVVGNGFSTDLIGVVQNVSGLNLTSNDFTFVG